MIARHTIKGLIGIAGQYSCEYCTKKAFFPGNKDKEDERLRAPPGHPVQSDEERPLPPARERKRKCNAFNALLPGDSDESCLPVSDEEHPLPPGKRKRLTKKKGQPGRGSGPASAPQGPRGISWPPSCFVEDEGDLRAAEECRRVAKSDLPADDVEGRKGIKGDTPLYDLKGDFDVVWDIPPESFHLISEGITKQILTRLIVKRQDKASDCLRQRLDEAYSSMRVFSEMSRRTSKLNVANLKGSDLTMMTLSVLPSLVVDLMTDEDVTGKIPENSTVEWDDRRKAITIYAFLVRLYYSSDKALADAEGFLGEFRTSLKDLHRKFYELYESGFCVRSKERCTINIHTFQHLEQSRRRSGPLWKTSAEPFESMYAVMRRSFRSGTRNVVKQVLGNMFLRATHAHSCGPGPMKLQPLKDKKKGKVADSLVWTAGEVPGAEEFYDIQLVDGDSVHAHTVHVSPLATNSDGLTLPWHLTGAYVYLETDTSEVQVIQRQDICGKAMRCGSVITTWDSRWLMSKIDQ